MTQPRDVFKILSPSITKKNHGWSWRSKKVSYRTDIFPLDFLLEQSLQRKSNSNWKVRSTWPTLSQVHWSPNLSTSTQVCGGFIFGWGFASWKSWKCCWISCIKVYYSLELLNSWKEHCRKLNHSFHNFLDYLLIFWMFYIYFYIQ